MSKALLIVEDNALNMKFFHDPLGAHGYDKLQIKDGMDGLQVREKIKANPNRMYIPMVMVTALSDTSDRVRGLEAGADDFLTKPVNDTDLFARVRSLIRLKIMMDELRLREATSNNFGVVDTQSTEINVNGRRILVGEDPENYTRNTKRALEDRHTVSIMTEAEAATAAARTSNVGLIVVSLLPQDTDCLRLCSQLRAMDESR